MSEQTLQPAIRSYFLGKGFQDVKDTIADAHRRNLDDAVDAKDTAQQLWSEGFFDKIKAIFFFAVAFFIVTFGSLFFLVLSIWHIALVAVLYLIFFSLFSLVRVSEQIYLWYRERSNPCPSCYETMAVPTYLCPQCQIPHSRLIPGKYGVIKRRCQCGETLPCTFFGGRNQLQAFCPHCQHALDASESRAIMFPIIGGPSVGKTSFRVASTHYLQSEQASKLNWELKFLNAQTELIFKNHEQEMLGDRLRQKTGIDQKTPHAFMYQIKHLKKNLEELIYLYDPAGEAFRSTDDIQQHKYYHYFDGLIILIDPLSLRGMEDYHDQLEQAPDLQQDMAPSDESLQNVLDRLIISLEKDYGVQRQEKIQKPCALVLNKVDALDFDAQFGHAAAERLLVSHPHLKTADAAVDYACREFLKSHGNEGLLQNLEQKFQNYQFFACASQLHQTQAPLVRADRPLLWLLSRSRSDLGKDLRSALKTGALN